MSALNDKIKGTANEFVGNVKQGVGAATDNEELEAEGTGQEIKGEAQQALGHAKEAVGDVLHKAAKAVKGS